MDNLSLKVLEKFLNFFVNKGYEPCSNHVKEMEADVDSIINTNLVWNSFPK